jgi:membrane protein
VWEFGFCFWPLQNEGSHEVSSGPREKLRLFLRALRKFHRDHGFLLSSGITFNFLICMIPLTLLLLSLVSPYLYTSREILRFISSHLQNVVPSLDPQILRNVMRIIGHRKIVGLVGFGGLIWSSTLVFSSLRSVFDIVFQIEKGRSILRGKAIDLLMVLLAGSFFLMSMGLSSAVGLIQSSYLSPFMDLGRIARFTLRYVIPFALTFSTLLLIYTILPNKKIQLKSFLQAAFFTSLLGEAAKHGFGWYVFHVGRFSMVYGSLSTLAIFFLLVYYSSVILILGGEVAFILDKSSPKRMPERRR